MGETSSLGMRIRVAADAFKPAFVALFVFLQIGRFWGLRTLGARWTTRIIMTPWAPPVTSGSFRFVRHPNYLIVALELPCASLALALLWHALAFGALNLIMIALAHSVGRPRVRSSCRVGFRI
jgi:isoprenylcysteine carboxyl methyltransferase (ICMT) family protein YpbQ